jgi:hypothetical protein
MGKMIALIAVALMFAGCGSTKLRTETIEVKVPVLSCPAPNYEELNRPAALPIQSLTPTSTAGEVAVSYKATVKILQNYIKRLELTLDQYGNTSAAFDELRNELENEE